MNVLSLDNLWKIIHLNGYMILKNMVLSSNYSDLISRNKNKTVWVFCLSLSWMNSGLQYWIEYYYYQYLSYSFYLLSSQDRDCDYKDEMAPWLSYFAMGIGVLRKKSLYSNWCMFGVCGFQWGIIPHQYWSATVNKAFSGDLDCLVCLMGKYQILENLIPIWDRYLQNDILCNLLWCVPISTDIWQIVSHIK